MIVSNTFQACLGRCASVFPEMVPRKQFCCVPGVRNWHFSDLAKCPTQREPKRTLLSPLGYFERSLFGAHSGPPDPKRVKALFRVSGIVNEGNTTPWGMSGIVKDWLVGDSVRPGRRGGLSAMRSAANANGCGRRAATLRRLSKDHANDYAITVEWMASREHVNRGFLSTSGAPMSCPSGALI